MNTLIKSPKNFWTGIIYLAVGLFGFYYSRSYPFGSASQMGPGYFPTVLSILLIFFGILALSKGICIKGEALGAFAWKATLCILLSTIAFGYLLERAGIVIALAILILGSALTSKKSRFDWKLIVFVTVMILFCVLVFVHGLGLHMPLLGSWFGR